MKGLIARKLGMTQVFDDTGIIVPVTVLEAGPCYVVGLRTQEKDGYVATRLGFEVVAEKKSTKPRLGEFKKAGVKPVRKIVEFRGDPTEGIEVGAELKADVFAAGDKVAVTGHLQGQGLRRRGQAPPLRPRPGHPRLAQHPPARLGRIGRRRPHLEGRQDGRPDGQRAHHHPRPDRVQG